MYSNVDIKKFGDMQANNSAAHNLRQIPSENVDSKKSHLNKFYAGSANMNFNQVLADKLSNFKLRKNLTALAESKNGANSTPQEEKKNFEEIQSNQVRKIKPR